MERKIKRSRPGQRKIAILAMLAAMSTLLVGGVFRANLSNAAEVSPQGSGDVSTQGNTCSAFPRRPPQDPKCNDNPPPAKGGKLIPVYAFNITEGMTFDRAGRRNTSGPGPDFVIRMVRGGTTTQPVTVRSSDAPILIGHTVEGNFLEMRATSQQVGVDDTDNEYVPVGARQCNASVSDEQHGDQMPNPTRQWIDYEFTVICR